MKLISLALLTLINISYSKGQSFILADSIIQKNSLQETVFFLSQDSLKGRFTGSGGAKVAAEFIAAKFDSIGLRYVQGNKGYFNTSFFNYNRKKVEVVNVMAVIPPLQPNDTMVIFSAHYDHIGQSDDFEHNYDYSNADDIYNGANDNATGVAALLELAKYYAAKKNNRYLLLFIAFSGEELGLVGSESLAQQLNLKLIKAVINLEMLGRPLRNRCYTISSKKTAVAKVLNRQLKKYDTQAKSDFFLNDIFPGESLFYRSDHYPFAKKVKNAFTIMGSSPEDQYYHIVDDEYSTIDFNFLLLATKNIAVSCSYFIE